jgi:hypothetical protein
VSDKGIQARSGNGQLNYISSAWGNHHRLVTYQMIGRIAIDILIAENAPNYVECLEQGWAGINQKNSYWLTGFGP